MNKNTLVTFPLWFLVILGFAGAAKVSLDNLSGTPCPHLFILPVCYLVLLAYGLMLSSLLINHKGCKQHLFCSGWGIAFAIALIASIAEASMGGGICPVSDGGSIRAVGAHTMIPLCYVSLAMLVAILVLFLVGPFRSKSLQA